MTLHRLAETDKEGLFTIGGNITQISNDLHNHDLKPVNSRDLANFIMNGPVIDTYEGREFMENGYWASEGIVVLPEDGYILTRKSPIFSFPAQVTSSHESEGFYHPDIQTMARLVKDAKDPNNKDVILIKEFPDSAMPILEMNEITSFLFQENAKKFGKFLYEGGIRKIYYEMPFNKKSEITGYRPHAHLIHQQIDKVSLNIVVNPDIDLSSDSGFKVVSLSQY